MRVIRKYEINRELETEFAKRDYIGKTFVSKNYGEFKVLGVYDLYVDNSNRKLRYVIEFLETGFQTVSFPNRIRNGQVRDYVKPFVCGIGYIGDFSYKDEPSKHFLYSNWNNMFDRCYNKNCKEYREFGEVHENWHCFKSFTKDVKNILGYKEMIENPKIKFSIDKDFLVEGNQLYSEETCCFIPQKINSFIMNTQKNREYNYEGFWIEGNKYRVQVNYRGKKINGGRFISPILAHKCYWKKKLELAYKCIEQDYPFLSEELCYVIYNRVKLREQISLNELQRAIEDGYFDDTM